jgi:hypothetical protein
LDLAQLTPTSHHLRIDPVAVHHPNSLHLRSHFHHHGHGRRDHQPNLGSRSQESQIPIAALVELGGESLSLPMEWRRLEQACHPGSAAQYIPLVLEVFHLLHQPLLPLLPRPLLEM